MKNINTSAWALCVLTLKVVCGVVFSTGVIWTKYEYRSTFDGYRCVPNETIFKANDTDPLTCGKTCRLNNQCRSYFYQPDNLQCIGCRVYLYRQLWTNLLEELPGSMYFSEMKQNLLTNCKAILENDPSAASGPYEITIEDIVLKVYCDMTTDGGGWTVFQNRFDGSVDFYRNFSDYENGFGDLNGEFWLGLRYIQILSNNHLSEFRMVLTKADGVEGYEHYKEFNLWNGKDYILSVRGPWASANIPEQVDRFGFLDSIKKGLAFTTFDRDVDFLSAGNCAVDYHGAWWFNSCSTVHLNGEYCTPVIYCTGKPGLFHTAFAGLEPLKKSKMMIRPQI